MTSGFAMNEAQILLVDDQAGSADLLGSILRRDGFTRVSIFTDPYAALDATIHGRPDLIVLDLHMPQLDGLAFLNTLREKQSALDFVPVLVLTADVTRDALRSALRAGANDYVVKPAHSDELLLRVHNLLSIRFCHEVLKSHNAALSAELRNQAQFRTERDADRGHKIHTMRRIIARGGPQIVFQPVVDLATGATLGVEALARFGTEPRRTPDQWFAERRGRRPGSRAGARRDRRGPSSTRRPRPELDHGGQRVTVDDLHARVSTS